MMLLLLLLQVPMSHASEEKDYIINITITAGNALFMDKQLKLYFPDLAPKIIPLCAPGEISLVLFAKELQHILIDYYYKKNIPYNDLTYNLILKTLFGTYDRNVKILKGLNESQKRIIFQKKLGRLEVSNQALKQLQEIDLYEPPSIVSNSNPPSSLKRKNSPAPLDRIHKKPVLKKRDEPIWTKHMYSDVWLG